MKEEYPPARMVKFTMIRWGNNREASVYMWNAIMKRVRREEMATTWIR